MGVGEIPWTKQERHGTLRPSPILDMSEPIQDDQSGWVVADLQAGERKFELPELTDETQIVRYVSLSTLFLYLSNRAFIPSLELLRRKDGFEGMGDVGSVFNPKLKATLDSLFEQHRDFLRGNPPGGKTLWEWVSVSGLKG